MTRVTRSIVLIALALLGPLTLRAQAPAPDTAGVRRAALDYIEGFYEGDSTKLLRSVRPDVHKFGYWLPRDSTRYQTEVMPFADFLSYARNVKARNRPAPASAPKEVVVYDVQDQTASAKVRAFWGTDYLLLGRFEGRWMITHVLWQSPPRRPVR
jgi:hypothetical protein